VFNMVALRDPAHPDHVLPPPPTREDAPIDAPLRMVEMVFPDRINHYGTLFGGEALAMMGKAAFIAATRQSRRAVIIAASQRVDFSAPTAGGDLVELVPRVVRENDSTITVSVEFWAERLLTGERHQSALGEFVLAPRPREGPD
jgi:acyl-CoA hydrolase